MEPARDPALSIILATPDDYESIRLTMRYLRAQTVRERLEILLVGPTEEAIRAPESDLAGFWGHQRIAVGPVTSISRANAAAVRRARAPLVALAEDHCFPESDWAAALIAAHEGPWAVVGPAIRNANPATLVSWCDFVVGYGPWMEPVEAGPAPFLPGHNSCYKTAILREYRARLEDMLEAETVLHFDLRHRGHQLGLAPTARAAHTNFALITSWLPVMYHQGRVFGASRARAWGPGRRLLYAAASPLIPAVRLWRCLREMRRLGRAAPSPIRLGPLLALGLTMDGAGQAMGYLFGAGGAVERVARFEFHRFRHVPEADRRAAQAAAPPP
jgi:hypothetical protein